MPIRLPRVNLKLRENKAFEVEIKRRVAMVFVARERIVDVAEATGEMAGTTGCPCCVGGQLRYSIASNGHVHAACSTENCVRWME